MRLNNPVAVGLAFALVVGCTTGEKPGADSLASAAAAPTAGAEFVGLADGDSVALPLIVRLSAIGVEIVPATGLKEEGKGHHHLVIDGDVPSDTLPLPSPPVAIHLGTGVSEYAVNSLPPGPHRIIAVIAFGNHVPMPGMKRDTVTVVVR